MRRLFCILLSFLFLFFSCGGTLAKAASVVAADDGISLMSYEPDDSDLNGSVLLKYYVNFYDKSGSLIDIQTSNDGSFTIPAGTFYFFFRYNYAEPMSFSGSYKYIISIKSIDPLVIKSCRYVQFIEDLDNGYYDIPVYDFTYKTTADSTEFNTITMTSYDVYYNNINTVRMSFYLDSVTEDSIFVESLILNIVPFDDLSLDETNSLISTSNNLLSNIISSISSAISAIAALPGQIIDLFIDAMKSLFVPSDGYFESKFNSLYASASEKLGILLIPFDIFSSLVNVLVSADNDFVIEFPAFNLTVGGTTYQLWDSYAFNLNNLIDDNFADLQNYLHIVTDVLLAGWFIRFLYMTYEKAVEGGTDDS